MILGTQAVTAWMGRDAFKEAKEPKEMHWIQGASHVDLYDKEQFVNPTVTKLAEFFSHKL